jgi:hypothetical protein
VAAHVIENHRHLVFGQLLNQPEQLLALHAHDPRLASRTGMPN